MAWKSLGFREKHRVYADTLRILREGIPKVVLGNALRMLTPNDHRGIWKALRVKELEGHGRVLNCLQATGSTPLPCHSLLIDLLRTLAPDKRIASQITNFTIAPNLVELEVDVCSNQTHSVFGAVVVEPIRRPFEASIFPFTLTVKTTGEKDSLPVVNAG